MINGSNNNSHATGKNRGTAVFPHSNGGVTKDMERQLTNNGARQTIWMETKRERERESKKIQRLIRQETQTTVRLTDRPRAERD